MRNSEEAKWLTMGFPKNVSQCRGVLPTQGYPRSAPADILKGQLQLLGTFLCQSLSENLLWKLIYLLKEYLSSEL